MITPNVYQTSTDISLFSPPTPRAKELQYARDTMMRLGDMKGVALVHVEMHQWGDAFQVMERYPELKEEVRDWEWVMERYLELRKR